MKDLETSDFEKLNISVVSKPAPMISTLIFPLNPPPVVIVKSVDATLTNPELGPAN